MITRAEAPEELYQDEHTTIIQALIVTARVSVNVVMQLSSRFSGELSDMYWARVYRITQKVAKKSLLLE